MKTMKEVYKDENGTMYWYKRNTAIECAKAKCNQRNKDIKGMNLFQQGQTTYASKAQLMEEYSNTHHVSAETVKKWLSPVGGNNPKTIQEIHELETFLEQPVGSFLSRINNNDERDNTMNCEIRSVEKESARELYIALLETIDATFPTFRAFVNNICHNDYMFIDGMTNKRYEIMLRIRKTGLDLPKALRDSAMKLVDRIYGPESDDPDAYFNTEEYKEFISSDDYQKYLERNRLEGQGLSFPGDVLMDRYNYCEFVKESCYVLLDEIFSMYTCQA